MKIWQILFCFIFLPLIGMEGSKESEIQDKKIADDGKTKPKKLQRSITSLITSASIGIRITETDFKGLLPLYQRAHLKLAWKTLEATCKDFPYAAIESRPGVTAAVFIDSQKAVIGTRNGEIYLCDIEKNKVLSSSKNVHTMKINAIVTYGNMILTASHDKTANIFSIQGEKILCKNTFTFEREVVCGAFSLDGKKILLGTIDGKAYLYTANGQCLRVFNHNDERNDQQVHAVTFSKNNRALTACMDHTIKLWNLETGVCEKTWDAHWDNCIFRSAGISPLGNLALMSFNDRQVKVIPLINEGQPGAMQTLADIDETKGRSFAFCDDGKFILIGSEAKYTKLFYINENNTIELLTTLNGHKNTVRTVAMSPDKTTIICGDSEPPMKADAKGNLKVWTVKEHAKKLTSAASIVGAANS